MNVLPDVYICPLRKKTEPLLHEGTVKCTHLPAWQSLQSMIAEIRESGAIAKVSI